MSFWNTSLAMLAASVLFAAPAFADGTPGQRVNRGPEPVQAHQPTPPEPGCYLIEDGQAWSCPAKPVTKPATKRATKTSSKPCCGTFTRTVVKEHAPVITQRTVTHRKAPSITRETTRTVRKTETSSEVRLDMASFSGGVGNGIEGGFYGGGGAVVITGGSSFSVLSHRASSFTFQHRYRGGGKKRRRGGGCGCK